MDLGPAKACPEESPSDVLVNHFGSGASRVGGGDVYVGNPIFYSHVPNHAEISAREVWDLRIRNGFSGSSREGNAEFGHRAHHSAPGYARGRYCI